MRTARVRRHPGGSGPKRPDPALPIPAGGRLPTSRTRSALVHHHVGPAPAGAGAASGGPAGTFGWLRPWQLATATVAVATTGVAQRL